MQKLRDGKTIWQGSRFVGRKSICSYLKNSYKERMQICCRLASFSFFLVLFQDLYRKPLRGDRISLPRVSRAFPEVILIFFRRDQFVTFPVDVDDFDVFIVLQVFAQLGNVDIHRACVEVIVINPNGLQGKVAL